MKTLSLVLRSFSYIFLIVATFITVYPILYMALGAFTTPEQLMATIVMPIPNTLNLEFVSRVWENGLWQAYSFTLARCLFYVIVSVFVGLIGGYILSKLQFPGKNTVFLILLSGMVMPAVLLILPMFLMMAWVPLTGDNNILGQGGHGLINDWRVLFVFGWVPPFAIFLFKQNFDMLPNEYSDAAKMDGAGLFTIIFRVYAPLLKPVIATVIMITFLTIWNEFLWPSVAFSSQSDFVPITVRFQGIILGNFSTTNNGPSPLAFMLVFLILWPPAAVYFLLQRYFVQGLVATGLKG